MSLAFFTGLTSRCRSSLLVLFAPVAPRRIFAGVYNAPRRRNGRRCAALLLIAYKKFRLVLIFVLPSSRKEGVDGGGRGEGARGRQANEGETSDISPIADKPMEPRPRDD